MNIEIRTASRNDLPDILGLYADKEIDDGEALSLEEAGRVFDRMSRYPEYKVYVARTDGKTVGTFALAIMENLAHNGKASGLVEDVVVAEEYRSRGIGKAMMEYAMNVCRMHRCYKMSLSSNLGREHAHSFYEKLGFRKHGFSFCVDL